MKKIIALGSVLGLPAVAFADYAAATTFETILIKVNQLLGYILPLLITVAVIYFVWGIVQFIMSSDEEAKKGGRAKIINGLIGLFVIVAFWGIIGIVMNTFGVGNASGRNIVPCTPTYTAAGQLMPC
ncbi:MAG: hypothetical protein WC241_01405 [Candidatus Paceibacterota bacterium]|jgi:hypothetical protein